jgi:hypothetical protein
MTDDAVDSRRAAACVRLSGGRIVFARWPDLVRRRASVRIDIGRVAGFHSGSPTGVVAFTEKARPELAAQHLSFINLAGARDAACGADYSPHRNSNFREAQ